MAEEGSEREHGRAPSSDSVESRWVFQNDDDLDTDNDNDDDDDLHTGRDMESEDDENADLRLVRTSPRMDSFDVEALEVPGARTNDFEVHLSSIAGMSLLV